MKCWVCLVCCERLFLCGTEVELQGCELAGEPWLLYNMLGNIATAFLSS